MSFDYFNTSHLAFGSKLTRAFRQLEKLCTDSENILDRYNRAVRYLGQYVNRNYRVPVPANPDSASRVDELFDVINDEYNLKELSYSDNILSVAINYFNRGTKRFTIARGSTELKAGYAFMKYSISNSNPTSAITFVEDRNEGAGNLLFQFRIDSGNNVNVIPNEEALIKFTLGGVDHINNMYIGGNVTFPYTATDYEAILVTGVRTNNSSSIYLIQNGSLISESNGCAEQMYAVAYLKPNDTLTAAIYGAAKKIIYNKV